MTTNLTAQDVAVATFHANIKVDKLVVFSFVPAGAVGWLLTIRTSCATANLGTRHTVQRLCR